jgi:hypothetical protein
LADTDEKVGLKAIDSRVARARTFAKMLDSAARVPGTNIRVGLDSLLGLIPGVGDATGAIFSGYLILLASRMGLPRETITRMVVNVAIDTIVGGIPVLGDLFDIGWKSNMKNVELLQASVDPVHVQQPANRALVAAVIVVLLLSVAGGIWLMISAFRVVIAAVT